MPELGLITAGLTHQGKIRQANQDHFLINRQLNLFAVSDGIESAPYGDLASKMAVEKLESLLKDFDLSRDATPPSGDHPAVPLPVRALKYSFREVNRQIYNLGQENPKYKGMGTTLTALWIYQGRAYVGHIGDSRGYLIRENAAQQLTQDHTSLAEAPMKLAEDMELYEGIQHASEHELTRALGINPDVQVQLAGGVPRSGDRFLLCTDGLYSEAQTWEIVQTVTADPPQLACRKLVQLANQKGGSDNIAVVIVHIE